MKFNSALLTGNGKVLIAGSLPVDFSFISNMLAKGGYHVEAIPPGMTAIEAAINTSPDVILIDTTSPDLNGFAIGQAFTSNDLTSAIPLIYLCDRTDLTKQKQAFTSGAADIITMPIRYEEIKVRVDTQVKLSRLQSNMENQVIRQVDDIIRTNETLKSEIAERRRIQELIITTIMSIDEGVIATDDTGLITILNYAAEKILGYSEVDALDRPVQNIIKLIDSVSGQPIPDVINALFVMNEEQVKSEDYHAPILLARDGTRRYIGGSIANIMSTDNHIIGHVIVLQDITERQKIEAQSNLSKKMESIGQLAAGIAHEINTPIQFIGDNLQYINQAFTRIADMEMVSMQFISDHVNERITPEDVQVLAEKRKKDRIRKYIDEVPDAIQESSDGIERVRKIVLAIREFSHPTAKEKRMSDLNHSIDTIITLAKNEWKYVADLETDFDPDLPLVNCQVDQINQVILNIIINAVQAIQEANREYPERKGTIRISTAHDVEKVKIIIQDTGCGIPENIRGKIFDLFFTTKGVGKGTSQGLSIAHNIIVQKHGGKITVDSEVGVGSIFTIELPINTRVELLEEFGSSLADLTVQTGKKERKLSQSEIDALLDRR